MVMGSCPVSGVGSCREEVIGTRAQVLDVSIMTSNDILKKQKLQLWKGQDALDKG